MPSNDVIQAFTDAADAAMAGPINTYFNVVDRYGIDSTQAVVAQSLARVDLERMLRSIHTQAALLGGGGELSDDAKGILQEIVNQDGDYLNNFMTVLPNLSREQALFRSGLYVDTARNTMNDIVSLEMPTLPVYPKDRDKLDCGQWCTCTLDVHFLFGSGNYDVYWDLDPEVKEACDSCITLSQIWKPLRIRGGVIQAVKEISQHDLQHIRALLFIALEKAA